MAASLDSSFKRTTASLSPNPDTLSCTSLFIFPHGAYHLIYMTHLLPDPHPWVYKLLGRQGLRTFSFYLPPVFFSAGSPVPGTWAHMWERHFKNVDWMNEPQTPLEFIRISFQAREQSVCLYFSSDLFICLCAYVTGRMDFIKPVFVSSLVCIRLACCFILTTVPPRMF